MRIRDFFCEVDNYVKKLRADKILHSTSRSGNRVNISILSRNFVDTCFVILIYLIHSIQDVIVHMNYVIEGTGALVNEKGEELSLKAGDFALVMPNEKHQYRNKGEGSFIMICGVPRGFE